MTIYSNPSSFNNLSFKASAPCSCESLDSLCSSFSNKTSNNTNTTTDCESLSLLSFPSEEEDWREFGYLLDYKDVDDFIPAKGRPFLRTNSVPTPPSSQHGESTESDFSSLDVEASSSANSCKRGINDNQDDKEDSEPVAKRTRNSLSKRETLREGLDKLSDIPKEERIYNFLSSSSADAAASASNKITGVDKEWEEEKPTTQCSVKWHNVCRPWWHNKLLKFSEFPVQTSTPHSNSEEENTENKEVIRKPRDPDALCDPRFISLGGNTTQTKEGTFKPEVDSSCDNPKILTSSENDSHFTDAKVVFGDSTQHYNQQSESRKLKRNIQSSCTDKTEEEEPETGNRKTTTGKRARRSSMENPKSDGMQSPSRRSSKRQQKVIQDNDADEEDNPDREDTDSKRCTCGQICGPSEPKKFYVTCTHCKHHYHGKCVGLTEKKAQKLNSWMCAQCEKEKSTTEELYCVCRQPYNDRRFYVGCDSCEDWFHPECIGTTQEEISQFDEFICPKCRESLPSNTN